LEIGLTVLLSGLTLYGFKDYRQAGRRIRDLMDLPSVVDQYTVEVRYVRWGAEYGRDVGIVCFADTALHFQGRQSSFTLFQRIKSRYSDRLEVTGDGSRSKYRQPGYTVGPAVNQRDVNIELVVYDRIPGISKGLRKRFKAAFDDWKKLCLHSQLPMVLPPLRPHPKLVSASRLRLLGAVLTALASLALVLVASFDQNSLLAVLGLVVFLPFSLKPLLRQIRFNRKLSVVVRDGARQEMVLAMAARPLQADLGPEKSTLSR